MMARALKFFGGKIRFDRNELSGAFGDIGTDFPLVVSMILVSGLGLAIGLLMLFLALTGLIDWIARVVPKSVVRGVQFGLGLQLATIALKNYVSAEGGIGYGFGAPPLLAAPLLL